MILQVSAVAGFLDCFFFKVRPTGSWSNGEVRQQTRVSAKIRVMRKSMAVTFFDAEDPTFF